MEKRPAKFSRRHFILAAAFTFSFVVFETVFLTQKYEISILEKYFAAGAFLRPLFLIFLSAATFALTAFFVWAALASPYRYKIFYLAVLSLAVLTEYGYQSVFSRFTNLGDAANAFIASDWRIKTNAAAEYFSYAAIIPCVIFAVLLFSIKPAQKHGLKIFLVVLLAFGGFFSLTSYFTNNTFYTISLTAFCRTVINFPLHWYVGSLRQSSESITYYAPRIEVGYRAASAPTNNIVFIVDESVRGDHLSLNNYARPTTPRLDELNRKGFVRNWGIAASGTTCSLTSNNLMLTGIDDLPDTDGKLYKYPTIYQYARAAGYKTFYFDGQVSYLWNGKPADIEFIDEWTNKSAFEGKELFEIDAEIARRVRRITEGSTGNFIWISKFGLHKPYQDSYPPDERKWLPVAGGDDRSTTYKSNLDSGMISNDYDNALLFDSESFFKNLLGEEVAKDTIYVYTSDHGQTLGENGAVASHCSDNKSEATVPLFIVADPQQLPAADTTYKASHANLFAALLDLLQIPDTERKYNYATSLLKAKGADSKPRFYYVGDLHSSNGSGKFPFD